MRRNQWDKTNLGSALLVGTRSRDIQRWLESADPTRMLASRAQVGEVWHRHRSLAARNNRVVATASIAK